MSYSGTREHNVLYLHIIMLQDKLGKLTAMGHHRGEEYHSPGPQIQAASLISKDLPIGLQGQTYAQVHHAVLGSC